MSQTQMLRRLFSGERKARRLPSGEISAPLIFGLSKKSLRGIAGGLLAVCATKEWSADKAQINNSKIKMIFISLKIYPPTGRLMRRAFAVALLPRQ